jgi:hypothetical protein
MLTMRVKQESRATVLRLAKAEGPVDEAAVANVFDQLKPITPDFLFGDWKGQSVNTGHPLQKQLETGKWAGKHFKSVDDVDPVMIYQDDGSRVWNQEYGNARVRAFLSKSPPSRSSLSYLLAPSP